MARRGLNTVGKIAKGLLDLFHYSDEPLKVIDPARQLTNPNIRGQERRLASPTRLTPFREEPEVIIQDYPDQSYFGDQNYFPESGLGDYVHHTREPAEGFYDISQDIDKFFPIALEEVKDLAVKYKKELNPVEINELALARAMKYAKQFGFLGLSNRKYRPDVYTQFQKVIPKDVSRRDGSVGELIEYLKRAGE
tara:strand:+ start:2537 stop:3118 length:582 start_codon:yes stop_codon:yes gene_type:complete